MSSENSEQRDNDRLYEQEVELRVNHDLRASIAVTRGFNTALESSLSELSQALHQALVEHDADPDGEPMLRIRGLEQDCHFCISRINRSLEQLDERVGTATRVVLESANNARRDDA